MSAQTVDEKVVPPLDLPLDVRALRRELSERMGFGQPVSQPELAEMLDCSQWVVHRWEKGTNLPDPEMIKRLLKLANEYQIPLERILEKSDPRVTSLLADPNLHMRMLKREFWRWIDEEEGLKQAALKAPAFVGAMFRALKYMGQGISPWAFASRTGLNAQSVGRWMQMAGDENLHAASIDIRVRRKIANVLASLSQISKRIGPDKRVEEMVTDPEIHTKMLRPKFWSQLGKEKWLREAALTDARFVKAMLQALKYYCRDEYPTVFAKRTGLNHASLYNWLKIADGDLYAISHTRPKVRWKIADVLAILAVSGGKGCVDAEEDDEEGNKEN